MSQKSEKVDDDFESLSPRERLLRRQEALKKSKIDKKSPKKE